MANQIKKGDIVLVKKEYHLKGHPRMRYEVCRVYKTMALLKPVKRGYRMTYFLGALEKEV